MSPFRPAFVLVLAAALVFIPGCVQEQTDSKTAEMKLVAGDLKTSINTGLAETREGLGNTSRVLSASGLSGDQAEKALADNLMKHPWAVSSLVVSRNGTVVTAVPRQHAGSIGSDLSLDPHFIAAKERKSPVVSPVFRLVEGFNGIVQSYPVVSPSGEYLGYVDITYPPEVFLGRYLETAMNGTSYEIWVAQSDGTQLYDVTAEEIGRNILSDPLYADPVLHQVLARIAREPSGTGSYTFYDRDWNRNITKIAVWDTAGIDGAEWRVVVTREDTGTLVHDVKTMNAGSPVPAQNANLTRFVQDAYQFAKDHGKAAALAEFNNPEGKFIDKDLYIFAYEMNGTVIALPYQQGVLGTDRSAVTDPNGVAFITRLAEVAREGGGYVYYIYQNPADNYREQFKLSYVLPVDKEWFLGSGVYLPELPAKVNATERDELVERVKQARRYAEVNGREKSVADFNDLKGVFANGSRYIFAYDFNGTTLAMPYQPETIGSDRMNFTDDHGVRIAAWEIATAQRGGGFVYVDYYNPDTGTNGMKLCYVVPVDDHWLVGSGIYTGRT
jgi:hypothetical protein